MKVSFSLLSACAIACGAMTVTAPSAIAADGAPTLTAKAWAPVPGHPEITDNQDVSKENLKDAKVEVHLDGLEPEKRYSLEVVAYDAHDPDDPHAWDEEDNPMYFSPPSSWQAGNALPSYPFELTIAQPLDFTAKSSQQDVTVNIGNPLKMFAEFDESLDTLIDHGKFVLVTRLRDLQTHDPSKPLNQTRRELQMNPVVAESPSRDASEDVIEDVTLTAVRELALPEETQKPTETTKETTSTSPSMSSTSAEPTTKPAEPTSTSAEPTATTKPAETTSKAQQTSSKPAETSSKTPVTTTTSSEATTSSVVSSSAPVTKPVGNVGVPTSEPATQSEDPAEDPAADKVQSASVYAVDDEGNQTQDITPDNASTAVQHLELENLEPGAGYSVQTYMRVDDPEGDYISEGANKTPMLFSAEPVTADDSGKLSVDVPLNKLADDSFTSPFDEGQEELKAVVQNKVVTRDVGTEGQEVSEPTEIFTYPNAFTPDPEVDKQTLTFTRDLWEEVASENASDTSETSTAPETDKSGTDSSAQKLPGKQDTGNSVSKNQDDALAKKMSNGTKVLPGGDVAPGSPAQSVGNYQATTAQPDSKKVSLNPPPKDSGVTITSDAGIVGGKLTKGAVVVDNVSFTGLRPDTDYALKGELFCVATRKSTGAANSITFHTPKSDKPTVDGSTVLSIPVLSDECAEQIVVETLYDAVSVDKNTLEAGSMVATTAGTPVTEAATVKDGKSATPVVVTQQVQPAKGAQAQPTSSVRVIRSVKSPSTVTSTGSPKANVGAALSPKAERVVVSNVPSGPVGLPAQSAPFIE